MLDKLREIMRQGWAPVPTLLTIDPPWHTRYRGTVAPYFTPRPIAALRPAIEVIVDRLIDGWIDEGRIDFVERFAVPLPIEAIAHVLNVPTDRMADFKRWSDDSIVSIGAMPSDERRIEAQLGILEFQRYFAAQLDERRSNPQGDLMSDLVQACIETDDGHRAPADDGRDALASSSSSWWPATRRPPRRSPRASCCWPSIPASGRR